jgi:hypothetical protein
MIEASSRTLAQAVLSAWQAELKATHDPSTKQQCLQREPNLLPRFTEQYQQLKALPRRVRRSLQRQWKISLAGVALLLTLGQAPALAATINVGGSCTLVDAITAANNNAATGGCTAGSGADTLVLPANSTQTLTTVNNTSLPATGLPVIGSIITMAGNGSTIRRDPGAPDFRIFAVSSSGSLTLQRTTVSGGRAIAPFGGGAGVFSQGTLTLNNSTISRNSGGGVFDASGRLSVTNSTISGNSAGAGGGIISYGATITNSTISGNAAKFGGGGFLNFMTATVTNSTISGNTSSYSGGAVINGGRGTLTLTNTTISGNTGSSGGGVSNRGTLTLNRTLVSGNTATSGIAPELDNQHTVIANNFNLFGHDGNAGVGRLSPGPTDIVPTQSLSAILNTTLANNGGPTRTHALVGGSPAIDTVTDGTCPPPARDQRGVRRPQDGNNDGVAICDTGSFERR